MVAYSLFQVEVGGVSSSLATFLEYRRRTVRLRRAVEAAELVAVADGPTF
jgi:hypothetical protein